MKSIAHRHASWLAICTIAAAVVASTGCGDDVSHDGVPSVDAAPVMHRDADRSLDAVRSRADAAFAAMADDGRSRSTSRIGPQPWPTDLPAAFPRPAIARVLADTRRDGDRLLLVDVPTPVDDAARDFDQALRAQGYSVAHTQTRKVPHALHASGVDGDAVLTFLSRDDATRVEILFLARSASGSAGG